MRTASKIYALTLTAVGFALLLAVVAANLLIDPQRMFGTRIFSTTRFENDRYHRYLDYRKSERNLDGLFFGSSRGKGGIPLTALSALTGGVAYADFAVVAGLITDHLPVLERAIQDKERRGERIKQVFLLLDVDLFGHLPQTNRHLNTWLHPDLTGEERLRFWVRYLTAIQFRAWRDTLRRGSAPKGRVVFLNESFAPSPRVRLAAIGTPIPLQRPGNPIRVTARPDYRHQLELVGRFAELCRRRSVNLTVAISPLHRVVADIFDIRDLAAAVADISQIVPVWDFSTPSWLSSRADLWHDNSHFSAVVGQMMLDRIFNGALPEEGLPFGIYRDAARAAQ